MRQKAESYDQYGEAAIIDMLTDALPEVINAAAQPLGAIDKMTVISTDGASELTKSVTSNVAQGLQLASDITGVDFDRLFASLASRSQVAASQPPTSPPSDGASEAVAG